MDYEVAFVDDDALPDGNDWVLVKMPDCWVFAVKRSRVSPQTMQEGWAAYRHRLSVPSPRVPVLA